MPGPFASLVAAFLPLFVAINIPGILPIYIGMTETFTATERRVLLVRALAAALILAVAMLFAGQVIFDALGITVNDLRVGGGLILLVIAITDLAFGELKNRRSGDEEEPDLHEGSTSMRDLPIVPLGIPLIIGPGAITTILVSEGSYGWLVTLLAIAINGALVFVAFSFGPKLLSIFGQDASKAVAKVASLFLAAISVAMIRGGIVGMIAAL